MICMYICQVPYMNRSKDLTLIQFNYTVGSLFYSSNLLCDFVVFIKTSLYKIMSTKLLLKFHMAHHCQKNIRDVLKSAQGASFDFMWILISSVSLNKNTAYRNCSCNINLKERKDKRERNH